MFIGKRGFKKLIGALFEKRHYIALKNMLIVYPDFFNSFNRYFWGTGSYPYKIKIRTPLGIIKPELFSYYDLLTVNEIFCRKDYFVDNDIKVVVDFGSNIGISALYFLTRNNFSKCYLFEPVPGNIKKLNKNLEDFKNRFVLEESAVSNENSVKSFGTEEYGRCGGLNRISAKYIQVNCVDVNSVLEKIIEKEGLIDVLKIDIEGSEIQVLLSIKKSCLAKIKIIYFEIDHSVFLPPDFSMFPEFFNQERIGNTIKLISKFY